MSASRVVIVTGAARGIGAAIATALAGLARAIPLGRTAQPADIAPAVAFLLSPGAGYITSQTFSVSGGLTMA